MFQPLGRAVRAARRDAQATPGYIDGLVVVAVRFKGRAAPCAQAAARQGLHGMAHAAPVPFHMLHQRAAEEYVQHLDAPADAEHGLAPRGKGREQGELLLVARRVYGKGIGFRGLPIIGGGKVAAPREHKAVETSRGRLRRTAGKSRGQRARRGESRAVIGG